MIGYGALLRVFSSTRPIRGSGMSRRFTPRHALTVVDLSFAIQINAETPWPGADPEGGAGGAHPPLFAPSSLKSPLKWPKKVLGASPRSPRPLLFQILDPPLMAFHTAPLSSGLIAPRVTIAEGNSNHLTL